MPSGLGILGDEDSGVGVRRKPVLGASPSAGRPLVPGALTLGEVLGGLMDTPARLPAKAFYDERGALLFEEITRVAEYYPTRVEREILHAQARAIAAEVGEGAIVIEYGSGAAEKSRILLPHLRPSAYVPVDVSGEQLARVAGELGDEYLEMTVYPVVADFADVVWLPTDVAEPGVRRVALFLGSTIGNFHPDEAAGFVRRVRDTVGLGGALLLGADLRKDPTVLHAAYNDARGVTAAFNKNVLERLEREFGARVDVDAFVHHAFYEPVRGRIEMHLVARRETRIELADASVHFGAGEGIWTESSYKFTRGGLAQLGEAGGMSLSRVWTDRRGWFALALYTAEG
jgi:dimethylhistidine N-methyltransferase